MRYCIAAKPTMMEKFIALGLSENTVAALQKKGWETPSPIQEQTIPLLLQDEKDIVGQAQTGTGKTGAFGLPLIEKLNDQSKKVQALILCPTRELAIQVAEEIASFVGTKKLSTVAIYGGASYAIQHKALLKGTQIVVGTPGRIRDHIERGTLRLENVSHVVLDEADEMLNMGFEEEVREILKSVPEQRRMLLFSATMPQQILKLAKTFMGDYNLVEIKKEELTATLTDQIYFEVRNADRFTALCRVIDTEPEFYGIVFCRTKMETDEVASKLIDRGFDAEAIHGDISQNQRENILKKFKLRKITILVATDVAARGIDVNDLTHVVNYNLPQDPEAYVHRIGRTGRAGKHGTAISIIAPQDMRDLFFIQKIAKAKIRKEEVPSVSDVIATKTMKMKTDLVQMLEKKVSANFTEMAQELLDDNANAVEILGAVLAYSMKDTLKPEHYQELGKVSSQPSASNGDKARLFVAKGHTSNMTADKVAQFIADEANINVDNISDIRVYDNFSFISLPPADAEQVLAIFGKSKQGGKSLVTRAKEKDGGGGSSRGFGGNRSGGSREGGSRDGGPRKSFGSSKPYSDKREGGEKREFSDKKFGDKKFGDRDKKPYGEKSFGDKKEYAPKSDFSKPRTSEFSKPKSDFAKPSFKDADAKPARKRENKLTSYLDAPVKTEKKAPVKKGDSSIVDDFMKKFDDDLSW